MLLTGLVPYSMTCKALAFMFLRKKYTTSSQKQRVNSIMVMSTRGCTFLHESYKGNTANMLPIMIGTPSPISLPIIRKRNTGKSTVLRADRHQCIAQLLLCIVASDTEAKFAGHHHGSASVDGRLSRRAQPSCRQSDA